jgi:hypothetical protein
VTASAEKRTERCEQQDMSCWMRDVLRIHGVHDALDDGTQRGGAFF